MNRYRQNHHHLKEKNPKVRIVAGDPVGSIYKDYARTHVKGQGQPYKVEGIGGDKIPTTLWFDYIDQFRQVADRDALIMARRLAREEGLLVGGSSGLNVVIALEVARDGITVNGVEPGYIRTAAMELLANEEGLKQMARYIPVGYIGAVEDIAHAMLYLASDEARYVTGQTLCVDGGSTLPESPVFLEELDNIKALQGSSPG